MACRRADRADKSVTEVCMCFHSLCLSPGRTFLHYNNTPVDAAVLIYRGLLFPLHYVVALPCRQRQGTEMCGPHQAQYGHPWGCLLCSTGKGARRKATCLLYAWPRYWWEEKNLWGFTMHTGVLLSMERAVVSQRGSCFSKWNTSNSYQWQQVSCWRRSSFPDSDDPL